MFIWIYYTGNWGSNILESFEKPHTSDLQEREEKSWYNGVIYVFGLKVLTFYN